MNYLHLFYIKYSKKKTKKKTHQIKNKSWIALLWILSVSVGKVSVVDSCSVEMRAAVEHVVRRHLLLQKQLRDGERVKGRAAGRVVGSLSGHAVVLSRGQRLEHHRGGLRSEVVLHLPLQLHPPVLEPGPHLRETQR